MSKAKDSTEIIETPRVQGLNLDPQSLIEQAIAKSAPVETMERLFELYKNVQAERARQAWYQAMAEFQRTCPAVLKTKKVTIPGKYSFEYAPLSEIMDKISPVMAPLGLSVGYTVKHDGNRVLATCRISHEMGHSVESGEVPIPVDTTIAPEKGATPAQRIGVAMSYAKRYALLAITGIAPSEDDSIPAGADNTGVRMPESASGTAEKPRPHQAEPNVWAGMVVGIKTKTGKDAKGNAWTLYILETGDAQQFSTFEKADADFAREAGKSKVSIVWEKTDKGYQKILSIAPYVEEAGQ